MTADAKAKTQSQAARIAERDAKLMATPTMAETMVRPCTLGSVITEH